MRVAIHQPNFLPWLGIFQRLFLVDVFLFFDHVQAMGGRSWLSRNRLLVGGQEYWLTMPVRKSGRLGQKVVEVEINYQVDFVPKHLKTIELNYRRAPHFDVVFPLLEALYLKRHTRISEFNMEFIESVARLLALPVRFARTSSLARENPQLEGLKGNAQILETCRAAGATEYVSGGGCLDFIEPASFERSGIAFYFQRFSHPVYPQIGSRQFVANLSILDALFNAGVPRTQEMIMQSTKDRPMEYAA
ncbi:MAG: WbqC family protein [Burkholderiales bacterium]|nr:WbqC family protein [Burkholderiales bacterium]